MLMQRKLFIGYRLNFTLSEQALEPLTTIPFEGREYIGLYLKTPEVTLKSLNQVAKQIEELLQQKIEISLRNHSPCLIAQLLLG
jgi:hypothetical protein